MLTEQHQANRLQYANDFINFGRENWHRTLMVDESTFCTASEGLLRVRRPLGTRFDRRFIHHIERSGRRSVSVWGMLTADGLGPLVRINGHLNALGYMDILEDHALPFINNFYEPFMNGNDMFWLEDSSPIHRAHIVQDFFNLNFNANRIPTPSRSLDLNSIEQVWAEIKKRNNKKHFSNENELWNAVEQEWLNLGNNADFCFNFVHSLPNRLRQVINNEGGSTRY